MDWLSVADIALTVIGFVLTLIAVWRTRRAVRETQRRLGDNMFLTLAPLLFRVEDDLDRAVAENDRGLARNALLAWRWQVVQLRGVLPANAPDELSALIQESLTVATSAKGTVVSTKKSVGLATVNARESMGRVTTALGLLASDLAAKRGDPE